MASPKKNKRTKKKSATPANNNNRSNPKKTSKTPPKKAAPKASNSLFQAPLLIAAAVLSLLTFFVYQGALDNDFVDWDDFAYVLENNLVRADSDIKSFTSTVNQVQTHNPTVGEHNTTIGDVFSRVISLNYHPLTVLTMRWNNNACPECSEGISARPFIMGNILLHILNTILVLFLTYWMTKKNLLASVFVALIFAIHPMHVESVAWVSERKDVLYTFFFLAGLLTYTKYLSEKTTKWLGITLFLFVLACLSKAMAVVFPLVMLLLYFWNSKAEDGIGALQDTVNPKNWMHTVPFFGVALLFGLMAASVQSGGDFHGLLQKSSSAVAINSFDTFTIVQRFQFACYGFLQYIIRFFLPFELCTFYPYPDQITYDNSMFFKVAPVLVLLLLGIALFSIKYTRSIATGMGFYLFTVILVLQFVSVGAVIMADRYTYLPYIGFAFMLVMLVQEFAPKSIHKGVYAGMIGLSLALIPLTISQIETWQDSDTLWTHVIELHKKDNVLSQNMEQALSIRGNYYGKQSEKVQGDAQMAFINKAFEDFKMAAQLGSKRPDVYEGIGNTYGMRGNYQEALKNYSIALQYNPGKGSTYFNRGVTYSLLRDHANAIQDYTAAMQHAPEQAPMAHLNRGISYVELGKRQEAIADFQKALQYNPNQDLAKRYLQQLTGQ